MKFIIVFFLSIICLEAVGQFMPKIETVIYDKDKNIIASLDYFDVYSHVETIFRDTTTNIRYKLDESHHFITALNVNGDTLWNIDPYVIARKEYTIKAYGPPLQYENLRADTFKKFNDSSYINYKQSEQKGGQIIKDTVWEVFDNINRPDYITQMKFGKNSVGETVLYLGADTRYYGYLDLKTGKFHATRRGW